MMSRKHYRAIAECFHEAHEAEHNRAEDIFSMARLGALARVQTSLAKKLREDNPRFDTGRFLAACIRGVK